MAMSLLQDLGNIKQYIQPANIEITSPPGVNLNDFRIAVNMQKATYEDGVLIHTEDILTVKKNLSELPIEVIMAVETTLLSFLAESYPDLPLISIVDQMREQGIIE